MGARPELDGRIARGQQPRRSVKLSPLAAGRAHAHRHIQHTRTHRGRSTLARRGAGSHPGIYPRGRPRGLRQGLLRPHARGLEGPGTRMYHHRHCLGVRGLERHGVHARPPRCAPGRHPDRSRLGTARTRTAVKPRSSTTIKRCGLGQRMQKNPPQRASAYPPPPDCALRAPRARWRAPRLRRPWH